MSTKYDVVVVGAGIFGACTAYHCQRLGLKTILLEQFDLFHSSGSSHGKSRITRYAHTEEPYVPLVADTYKQIAELEKKRNVKLWNKTGLLWVSDGNDLIKVSDALTKQKVEHELINGKAIGERYKMFNFPEEWSGLIDPMGGAIFADKWLSTFLDEFKDLGGEIKAQSPVLSHTIGENDEIIVKTPHQKFKTRKVIFTVGSWIGKLIPELNFEVEPISISVCYWKTKKPGDAYLLSGENFPVFIANESHLPHHHFALADVDYPGMIKFVFPHNSPLTNQLDHPKEHNEEAISHPSKFIRSFIPLVDGEKPTKIDLCKYTMSPDEHYIIGPIPNQSPNILVGGCGSGSGFKTAPGIGRALAEMAAGKKTTVDVSFFSADRFRH